MIRLTKRKRRELKRLSDVAVCVPEKETYLIQELHLPIYHCWCMMLEERFFAGGRRRREAGMKAAVVGSSGYKPVIYYKG